MFATMLVAVSLSLGIALDWTVPTAITAMLCSAWLLYLVITKLVKGGE